MLPAQTVKLSGLLFGTAAFSLFAVMPMYLQWLEPLSGYTVLAQRILFSSLLLIIVLAIAGKLIPYLQPLSSLRAWPGLIAGSILIGLQWGVFVWAPLNGQTLDLSLGYFLMPMVTVLIGRLYLKEQLRPLQWLSIFFAAIGVAWAYINSNGLSWVVIIIVVGYPIYLMLRRFQVLPSFSAFLIENLLLVPFAIAFIMLSGDINGGPLAHPFHYSFDWIALFLGLAVLGSVPMLCYISANKRLPISTLGLLSYLEPTLIFLVAYFFLNESIQPHEWFIYIPVAIGLVLSLIDGMTVSKKYNF